MTSRKRQSVLRTRAITAFGAMALIVSVSILYRDCSQCLWRL